MHCATDNMSPTDPADIKFSGTAASYKVQTKPSVRRVGPINDKQICMCPFAAAKKDMVRKQKQILRISAPAEHSV